MQQDNFIYIHIPFCLKKCNYCDFCSFPLEKYDTNLYINKLQQEIIESIEKHSIKNIRTIYIGGGTPSTLAINQIYKIIEPLQPIINNDNYEFTIEVNPATANATYFKGLKSLGVNRISAGMQSFNDRALKLLGRPHSVKDLYSTIDNIRQAGINNISFDLMYAIPEQTIDNWKDTLAKAVELDVPHISAYGLKIEPGTPFSQIYTSSHPDLPDDEVAETMFLMADNILTDTEYKHYEISNYSKPGFNCTHNLAYWYNYNYYGFGLAAHSFINNVRYENTTNMEDYLKNSFRNKKTHFLSTNQIMEDEIFLRLRLAEGLNIQNFNQKYQMNFFDRYGRIIEKYHKFFQINDDTVSLNLSGMLLSNNILSEFLD